ncbi:hypothetical protein KY343_03710 [Candidatus Woesearchaeota archaeon]|nr:hypothetical protein [Candidatus Woesearchaeota archaeon]
MKGIATIVILVGVLGLLFTGVYAAISPYVPDGKVLTVTESLAMMGIASPGLTEEEYDQARDEAVTIIQR